MAQAEAEARRAANRLRRALEKARREIDALQGALARAEGDDFPRHAYDEARGRIGQVVEFVDEESRRLQHKILVAGGLEPGRLRRASAREG